MCDSLNLHNLSIFFQNDMKRIKSRNFQLKKRLPKDDNNWDNF